MKLVLSTIAVLLFINSAQAEGWLDSDGYKHRYDCHQDWHNATSINFFLHGSGGSRLTEQPASLLADGDIQPLFDSILSNCGFLVIPLSPPDRSYTWDYTGYYTAEAETTRVVKIILLANYLFPNAPINLIGGSSGGIMAFAIAAKLNRIGHSGLIDKLVLLEAISPFDVPVNGMLPAFNGIDEDEIHKEHSFIRAGLPSNNASFDIVSLVVYSADDPVLAFSDKDALASAIAHFSSVSSTALVSGTDHKIGQDGWDAVGDFISDSL